MGGLLHVSFNSLYWVRAETEFYLWLQRNPFQFPLLGSCRNCSSKVRAIVIFQFPLLGSIVKHVALQVKLKLILSIPSIGFRQVVDIIKGSMNLSFNSLYWVLTKPFTTFSLFLAFLSIPSIGFTPMVIMVVYT